MSPKKVKRLIQPLGPRVLVRLVPESDRSESGLYLPQGVKERHQSSCYAQVIEVARDTLATEGIGENVTGVPVGRWTAALVTDPQATGEYHVIVRLQGGSEVRHVIATSN